MPNLITLGFVFFMLPLFVGGGMLYNGMRSDRRLAARMAGLHRTSRSIAAANAKPGESIRMIAIRMVSGVGDAVLRLGLLAGRTKIDVEAMLTGAGYSGNAALRLFIGAKILLVVILPAGMWLVTRSIGLGFTTQMIAVAAAAIGGMVGPDSIVGKLRKRHTQRIQDELPDALDMMVICAQAGLGLGTTIVRVTQELRITHRAIAIELAQTANEMQMTTDAKLPLINMAERSDVTGIKRLAATLLQSVQYGTPLTEALRGLAAELRAELILRFEAKAARMSVMLTLPMIAFNLPAVFLVIGGPAAIQVIHAIK